MTLGESLAGLLNIAVLGGCFVTKAPQLCRVLRARSVLGLSELALAVECIGYSATCYYHMLLHYPFAAWGESAIVATQEVTLLLLFWSLKPDIKMRRRVFCVGLWLFGSVWLFAATVPHVVVSALGCSPTALFILARLPQIALNARQGHTGHLAPATIALQLAGNLARMFTTLQLLAGDPVVLASQVAPAVLNSILLMQISRYRLVTRAIVACDVPGGQDKAIA